MVDTFLGQRQGDVKKGKIPATVGYGADAVSPVAFFEQGEDASLALIIDEITKQCAGHAAIVCEERGNIPRDF